MHHRQWIFACFAIACFWNVSAADTYQVDPVHSSVVFRIKHSDISFVYGLFAQVNGEFTLDGRGRFAIAIPVDGITSGNAQRDGHLKSPDFFSARQFPNIEFVSTNVEVVADGQMKVTGNMKIRGVTKPIQVEVIKTGTGAGRQGEPRGGMEARFPIKRSDFNLGGAGGLSDEVFIVVSLQGVKK